MKSKCKVCGKEITGYSLITGENRPCGHDGFDKKTIKRNKALLGEINKDMRII